MKTFQIQQQSDENAKYGIQAQNGQPERKRGKQVQHGKKQAKQDVADDRRNAGRKRRAKAIKDVVKDATCNSARGAREKAEKLISARHLNSFERVFPPYLTEETFPLAAKLPLPWEKTNTFRLLPVTVTFCPHTVK